MKEKNMENISVWNYSRIWVKYIEGDAVTALLGAYRNIFCNFWGMLHLIPLHEIDTDSIWSTQLFPSILKNESSKIYVLLSAIFILKIIWPSDDKISEFRPSKSQEWSQGKTWLDHSRLTLKYNHSEAIRNTSWEKSKLWWYCLRI